jgi:hypothetical protein
MIKYKIALVNVFWSETENNTRYFINKNEQSSYFDNLASGKTSPLVNYNMGNNIVTTIIYKDTTNRRVDEIVKSNYAIVYTIDYNEETKEETILNRRYFFAYPRQDSGRQMIVDLVLDDVQTNFIPQQNFFDRKVLITRAHLNRFVKDGNNFKFNIGTEESPFYQIEDFKECPKRLTKKTPLKVRVSYVSEVQTWYDENVLGWEYVYLTNGTNSEYQYKVLERTNDGYSQHDIDIDYTQYTIYGSDEWDFSPSSRYNRTRGNEFTGALICICAPVYKKDSTNGTENTIICGGCSICTKGIEEFLKLNDYNTRVYSRKFSLRPPFREIGTYPYAPYVDGTNVRISSRSFPAYPYQDIHENVGGVVSGYLTDPQDNKHSIGCFIVYLDTIGNGSISFKQYDVDKQLTFTASEIVNGSKDDIKFNPKLLSNQFFDLNLTHFSQSYTYDYEKLATDWFNVTYEEALTPDLTKGYARISGGLYIPDTRQNLTGLVISNDCSLMVANDKLSEMLANNKNFYLQQALNIGKSAIGGAVGGGFAGIGGIAGSVLGLGSGIANTYMNIDNMRNAPEQVRNANGNVYFAVDIQPFTLSIEEYDALDFDKKAFNDYCYMFGYKYNHMGFIRDFVNIRRRFNYIEADLVNVRTNIANEEKRRLIEKFKAGIRFWNTDYMEFSSQNAENEVWDALSEEVNNE